MEPQSSGCKQHTRNLQVAIFPSQTAVHAKDAIAGNMLYASLHVLSGPALSSLVPPGLR